jgi:hypothetical protein
MLAESFERADYEGPRQRIAVEEYKTNLGLVPLKSEMLVVMSPPPA